MPGHESPVPVVTLIEKHRTSELWANYTRWLLSAPRYDHRGTIVELSQTDTLMIRPQYQKIVRRTVAHLPNSHPQ